MNPRLQGDVQYRRIEALPTGLVEVERDQHGRLVIAQGEATGHHHAVKEASATLLVDPETGIRYLVAPNGAVISHEEHAAHAIEPGTYEFGRKAEDGSVVVNQREYSPEEIRNVAD